MIVSVIDVKWAAAISAVLGILFIGYTIYLTHMYKKDDKVSKGILALYSVDVILFFVFFGLSLWLFGYDYGKQIDAAVQAVVTIFDEKIGAIIGTLVTIFGTMFLIKFIDILIRKTLNHDLENKKRMTTILNLTRSVIKYALDFIAILVILIIWGVNVFPALAGLGVLGIIIGMGTQSMVKDFISGFFIVFEHQFDVGDIVEIDGWKGEVIDLGLKTSKIKNWKQDVKIINNGNITELINYTLTPSTAIVELSIGYKEDIQKTIDLLNIELPKFRTNFPAILEDPQVLGVTELADSSVVLRVIIKTEIEQHYGIERAFRQRIKELLDLNNIEIPFPQVVVNKANEK
jgi:small-conductance mechanosensitive channel